MDPGPLDAMRHVFTKGIKFLQGVASRASEMDLMGCGPIYRPPSQENPTPEEIIDKLSGLLFNTIVTQLSPIEYDLVKGFLNDLRLMLGRANVLLETKPPTDWASSGAHSPNYFVSARAQEEADLMSCVLSMLEFGDKESRARFLFLMRAMKPGLMVVTGVDQKGNLVAEPFGVVAQKTG